MSWRHFIYVLYQTTRASYLAQEKNSSLGLIWHLLNITHLVQSGVDLPTIKRIGGHKTLIMVERYAHANGEHIDAAMVKLDRRLKYGS